MSKQRQEEPGGLTRRQSWREVGGSSPSPKHRQGTHEMSNHVNSVQWARATHGPWTPKQAPAKAAGWLRSPPGHPAGTACA